MQLVLLGVVPMLLWRTAAAGRLDPPTGLIAAAVYGAVALAAEVPDELNVAEAPVGHEVPEELIELEVPEVPSELIEAEAPEIGEQVPEDVRGLDAPPCRASTR